MESEFLPTLHDAVHDAEHKAVKDAIEATTGNITQAAEILATTRLALQLRLRRKFPDLFDLAAELRMARNGTGMGHPRSSPMVTDDELRAALAVHGSVRAVSIALGIPRSTLRRMVNELASKSTTNK